MTTHPIPNEIYLSPQKIHVISARTISSKETKAFIFIALYKLY